MRTISPEEAALVGGGAEEQTKAPRANNPDGGNFGIIGDSWNDGPKLTWDGPAYEPSIVSRVAGAAAGWLRRTFPELKAKQDAKFKMTPETPQFGGLRG